MTRDTTTYPAGMERPETSDDTRRLYLDLIKRAEKRPEVSERTLDKLRVKWQLSQLMDAGIVSHVEYSGARYIIHARGWRGSRSYDLRGAEGFCHGADAALDR